MQLADPPKFATGDYNNSEVNKVLVDRFRTEMFGHGRFEVADEILSSDFTAHIAGFPEEWQRGPEGAKRIAREMWEAFPDVEFTHELVFARGGKVVDLWTMTGSHQGEIFGVPYSGNRVHVTGVDIFLVSPTGPGGKIVEMWSNWDQWGLLTQLGAVPAA